MARNRKRAKERRARRPQPVASRARDSAARGGVPDPVGRDREVPEALEPVDEEPLAAQAPESAEDDYEAPSPLEHAAPDVEIAEARLELGRLEQLDDEPGLALEQPEPTETGFDAETDGLDGDNGGASGSGGELAVPGPAQAQPRAVPGNRLINFLQGSWRELQRVQWPDRRQVMQATGVVIGFVIVAGVFLGVSDWVAGKVVSLIINGHF